MASTVVAAADMAEADMLNTEGSIIGKVTFEQTPSGVLLLVDVTGLPPGWHAIHLHSAGACTPDFSAAKGHINPYNVKHGPAPPRRAGQRRPAQPARCRRRFRQGGVLHRARLGGGRRHARASRRGRLRGRHPRPARRPHHPTHRRRRRTHRLRRHKRNLGNQVADHIPVGLQGVDVGLGRAYALAQAPHGHAAHGDVAGADGLPGLDVRAPGVGAGLVVDQRL